MTGSHPRAARVAMRAIGGVAMLIAILNFLGAMQVGSGPSLALGALTSLAYGWAGVGLWRMRESAWMAVMVILALAASTELAMFAATRDLMVGSAAAVNIGFIATLIWAGRQLSEPARARDDATTGPAA